MFSNILVEKFKVLIKCIFFSVSHTTDDLVFQWLPDEKVPLAVDQGIELPQLELVSNYTGDCTSVYSTGNWKKAGKFKLTKKKRKLSGSFFFGYFFVQNVIENPITWCMHKGIEVEKSYRCDDLHYYNCTRCAQCTKNAGQTGKKHWKWLIFPHFQCKVLSY